MKPAPEFSAIKQDLIARGVKYCVGAYVDIHGVPKGKVVPVGHFEDFASGSELYTGYALDGLGQSPNDDEIASVPTSSGACSSRGSPRLCGIRRTTPSTARRIRLTLA